MVDRASLIDSIKFVCSCQCGRDRHDLAVAQQEQMACSLRRRAAFVSLRNQLSSRSNSRFQYNLEAFLPCHPHHQVYLSRMREILPKVGAKYQQNPCFSGCLPTVARIRCFLPIAATSEPPSHPTTRHLRMDCQMLELQGICLQPRKCLPPQVAGHRLHQSRWCRGDHRPV